MQWADPGVTGRACLHTLLSVDCNTSPPTSVPVSTPESPLLVDKDKESRLSSPGETGTAKMALAVLMILAVGVAMGVAETPITDESLAAQFAEEFDRQVQHVYSKASLAAWIYNTNLTDYNKEKQVQANLEEAAFLKESSKNASMFAWRNFQNETLRRIFSEIADIGTAAMKDPVKLERLLNVLSEMEEIYSRGKVCLDSTRCLDLEPGLTRLLRTSRDYDELQRAWQGWREATGRRIKPLYEEFVRLSNEAIRDNGYNNTATYWISWYETATLEADVERLYQQLAPFYQHLHAYTRRFLRGIYGAARFPKTGHIPAHLLGNMWAQSWSNLQDDLRPFKGKDSVDVTDAMVEQGYTPLRMFNISDEFFQSLGLLPMPPEFWNGSMMAKPEDGRDVVCHASAWDFYNGKDFRIRLCTDVNMEDLVTVHREMGHVQYYLQYKHQPVVFRRGANPSFHEAIGDALALSVSTPEHLHKINLLRNVTNDHEADINCMMSMALDKTAFLPFGFLMDQWRWSVFRGDTPPSRYNDKWWQLRCKYQGIAPPVRRTEQDFDPGAKYHIPANIPYIRYFVSHILQFQFHKALCQAANHTGPLHRCDVYRSTEAGSRLSAMLRMGSSKPWPEALERMTGSREMNAGPLLEYFKPLIDWLKQQNQGDTIGWEEACPTDWPPPVGKDKGKGAASALQMSFEVTFLVVVVAAVL